MSGVDMLPSILTTAVFSVVSGGLVGKTGYYLPLAILGGVLVTLGQGLLSTFTPTTTIGIWIGYQIIVSSGRGMGFQIPLIAVQNHSTKDEVSIVNALVVFSQYLCGAIFLSLDQIVFINGLKHFLPIFAPEIDPKLIIEVGALGIRKSVPETSLAGVLLAYSKAIYRVMYLGTGAAGIVMLFSFGMGWKNIKAKAKVEKLAKLEKKEELLVEESTEGTAS